MRILIADDDKLSRHILARRLVDWGYDVEPTGDGDEAWARLCDPGCPRLAILDWVMPGLDGAEICRRVRAQAQEPYIYLVLLTARGRREDIIAGLDAGADDYLIKPFDDPELRVRLRAASRIVSLHTELVAAREALRFQARHDALTGLANRATATEALAQEAARAARSGRSLAAAMIDIDHFKKINDTHGHPAGDTVIREVARRIAAAVRAHDVVGRFGGEEFIAVLPDCDPAEALTVGERIRAAVAALPIDVPRHPLGATVSVGVASAHGLDADRLTALADAALYRAKRAGRNRVELGGESLERALRGERLSDRPSAHG
jgi:diguanylate cyclase (GGDEF)-like protein